LIQQLVSTRSGNGVLGVLKEPLAINVKVPASLKSVLAQYGDFNIEPLGTRFQVLDIESTLKSLLIVLSKSKNSTFDDKINVLLRSWIPTHVDDQRSKMLVATKIQSFIQSNVGVTIPIDELRGCVYTRRFKSWDMVTTAIQDATGLDLSVLFKPFSTEEEFFDLFSAQESKTVLDGLGLHWKNPSSRHPEFTVSIRDQAKTVAERINPVLHISPFFKTVGTQEGPKVRSGSSSQVSSVEHIGPLTKVQTLKSVPHTEASLLVCFPPSCVTHGVIMNVVFTTSVELRSAAEDFIQGDFI